MGRPDLAYPPDMLLMIPGHLVEAIEKYIATDWGAVDPSKIGALNAVAYIGEQITGLVTAALTKAKADAEAAIQRAAVDRFVTQPAKEAAFRRIAIEHGGGYDPRKGPKHPDNRDPTLEAEAWERIEQEMAKIMGDPNDPGLLAYRRTREAFPDGGEPARDAFYRFLAEEKKRAECARYGCGPYLNGRCTVCGKP